MMEKPFILPKWGGAMVHSDPQQTDNINLKVPKKNVDIVWPEDLYKRRKAGTQGNGIAGNGTIAANTFNGKKDNLILYDYNGKELWKSGYKLNLIATSSTPMIDIYNRVVVSDNNKIIMVGPKDDGYEILWKTCIDYEGPGLKETGLIVPFSPTIVDGQTIILPTKGGPTYAFDVNTGEKIAEIYLGLGEIATKDSFFSTINSACVNKQRVYILAEYEIPAKYRRKTYLSRLYAIDVNRKSKEIFKVKWFYPFIGRSQASPLLIKDTIHFDIFTSIFGIFEKPYVCAIIDKGDDYEEKWKVQYPQTYSGVWDPRGPTWYSFSKDPKGGFWYEDLGGKLLVKFNEENGKIIREIPVKTLVPSFDTGIFFPLSCMTICDEKERIMLISVISFWKNKYIIAVDLNIIDPPDESNNRVIKENPVIWRVKVDSKYGFNSAGGQFTILKKDNDPNNNRILCSTYWNGILAIGSVD